MHADDEDRAVLKSVRGHGWKLRSGTANFQDEARGRWRQSVPGPVAWRRELTGRMPACKVLR
jgi:hypothetical protein